VALVGGYVVCSILSIWLRSGMTVFALGDYGLDDALFVRLAQYLAAGQWLGPYTHLTLVKGMFFSLFIAASSVVGLPLKVCEQGVYLAAAGLTALLVVRLTRNRWLGLALFALLAFDPVMWHRDLARVVREGLYVSLSLAVVALFGLMLPLRFDAGARSMWNRLGVPLALGVIAGAYWLTREERPWLAPALVVLSGMYLFAAWRQWQVDRNGARRAMAATLMRAVAALVVFAAVVGTVDTVNWIRYGVFMNNEMLSDAFQAAYGALARIRPERWQRYVIVSRDARLKASAASPAARELKPTLEGDEWQRMQVLGCTAMDVDPCPDILSPWFVFALREAVRDAGHYGSARDAQTFYATLARELNEACTEGRLSCLPARSTLFPPFRLRYLTDALARIPDFLRMLAGMGGGEVGAPQSMGATGTLDPFRDLVGPITEDASPAWLLRGWVAATHGSPSISVRDRSGSLFSTTIMKTSGTDVEKALPGFQAMRFELQTSCTQASCELVVESSGAEDRVFPMASLHQGPLFISGDAAGFLDAFGLRDSFMGAPERRRHHLQFAIARRLASAYGAVMPVLSIVAVGGIVVAALSAVVRRQPITLLGFALACAAAVAGRVALLAYLHVTSMPTLIQVYLSPASPFLLVFVLLGLYAGSGALLPRLARVGMLRWNSQPNAAKSHLDERQLRPDGIAPASLETDGVHGG
jgi:hypothetical protein